MRLHFLIASILFAAIIGGCKPAETPTANGTTGSVSTPTEAKSGEIAGTWTSHTTGDEGVSTEFTFNGDNTYVMLADAPIPGKEAKINTETKGTWKVDGDKIALKMTGMTMNTKEPSMAAELEKQNAGMKDVIAKLPELAGKLEWKDKDNVTLTMEPAAGSTDKAQAFMLTRKA